MSALSFKLCVTYRPQTWSCCTALGRMLSKWKPLTLMWNYSEAFTSPNFPWPLWWPGSLTAWWQRRNKVTWPRVLYVWFFFFLFTYLTFVLYICLFFWQCQGSNPGPYACKQVLCRWRITSSPIDVVLITESLTSQYQELWIQSCGFCLFLEAFCPERKEVSPEPQHAHSSYLVLWVTQTCSLIKLLGTHKSFLLLYSAACLQTAASLSVFAFGKCQ